MTYRVNATELTLQPTEGRWLPRTQLGTSGTGHPIYSGARDFELRWQLISVSDFAQIQNFFNSVGVTGTVVVSLPQFDASAYQFQDYTGCVLQEPQVERYFTESRVSALLIVTNIRT